MKWLVKLILQILANAAGLAIAVYFVSQINLTGDIWDYLYIGIILALANLIVRPILKIVSAPLIFITLGLFIIAINAIILFAVDYFVEALTITGFYGYLWGTLIISLINGIAAGLTKKKKE